MSHTDKHLTSKIHTAGKGQMALWVFLSEYGIYAYVFFFLGVWFATDWNMSHLGMLCLAVGATLAVTLAIRYSVRRPRPDFLFTDYVPVMKKYSFPSAHASSAFSLATAIALIQMSGGISALALAVALVLYTMATLIAASRIMVGVHFLSDILAGAFLGTFISFLVFYFL